MSAKSSKKQGKTSSELCRDELGRFKAGQSGNPAGRPPGASYRGLAAARRWAEEKGMPMLMAAAEGGDLDAARFLVSIGMPKQRPVSLPEPLPEGADLPPPAGLAEQARAVLAAALSGELGADAAASHMALLASAVKIEEAAELRERVAALERSLSEHKTL